MRFVCSLTRTFCGWLLLFSLAVLARDYRFDGSVSEEVLRNYAWNWVREHDPDGYVQMTGMRIISGAADGKRWYDVNQPGAATPNGFGQEQIIRAIWTTDTNSAHVKR